MPIDSVEAGIVTAKINSIQPLLSQFAMSDTSMTTNFLLNFNLEFSFLSIVIGSLNHIYQLIYRITLKNMETCFFQSHVNTLQVFRMIHARKHKISRVF